MKTLPGAQLLKFYRFLSSWRGCVSHPLTMSHPVIQDFPCPEALAQPDSTLQTLVYSQTHTPQAHSCPHTG